MWLVSHLSRKGTKGNIYGMPQFTLQYQQPEPFDPFDWRYLSSFAGLLAVYYNDDTLAQSRPS